MHPDHDAKPMNLDTDSAARDGAEERLGCESTRDRDHGCNEKGSIPYGVVAARPESSPAAKDGVHGLRSAADSPVDDSNGDPAPSAASPGARGPHTFSYDAEEYLRQQIETLKAGMCGDYDLDAWLDWAIEKRQLLAESRAAEQELIRMNTEEHKRADEYQAKSECLQDRIDDLCWLLSRCREALLVPGLIEDIDAELRRQDDD